MKSNLFGLKALVTSPGFTNPRKGRWSSLVSWRLTPVITVLLFASYFWSCADSPIADNEIAKGIEREIVQRSGVGMTVDEFVELSAEDQKQFWIERLTSALEIGFNQSVESLIYDLIEELEEQELDEFIMTDAISGIGIDIAEVTSENTFKKVFGSFEDLPSAPTSGLSCGECIEELEDWASFGSGVGGQGPNLPKCNCRWTCGSHGSACTHEKCEKRRGCGFFGIQTCNGRDELYIGDCP